MSSHDKSLHLETFLKQGVEQRTTDLLCHLTDAAGSKKTSRLHGNVEQHKWTHNGVDNTRAKLLQVACT